MLSKLCSAICAVAVAAPFAFAQSIALEQDARVIEVLRQNGSDFSKLHRVDYHFVMPTETSARAIASELVSAGFAVQRIGMPAQRKTWEVHVQRAQIVELDAMQATTVAFTKLAERFGGMYDGWGAPVAK